MSGSGEPSTQVSNERPTVPTTVTVSDVTGAEDSFTLDSHGFAFHAHASKEQEHGFHDEGVLRAKYYPECEQLLRNLYAILFSIMILSWFCRRH